jgi:tripartite-type tricarboxylate transporter receptor subunit TctC
LVAEAKANPGKINIGTVAIGSAQYLAAEIFKSAAGIHAVTVPYKTSGDVVMAVKTNDVQAAFETLAPVTPHLKAKALKAIAYSGAERFPGLANVPTVSEAGLPGYDVSAWNGIAAPAKTPRSVVDRLNREMNAVLALPEVQQRFLELGIVATGGTPEQLTATLVKDIAKWKDAIEKAKIEKQ